METRRSHPIEKTSSMRISLKVRNVPKLLVVWVLNATVFSGVVTGILDVRDIEALQVLLSECSSAR